MPVAPKPPDYFGDISLTTAVIIKYLKEGCSFNYNSPFNTWQNYVSIGIVFINILGSEDRTLIK